VNLNSRTEAEEYARQGIDPGRPAQMRLLAYAQVHATLHLADQVAAVAAAVAVPPGPPAVDVEFVPGVGRDPAETVAGMTTDMRRRLAAGTRWIAIGSVLRMLGDTVPR